MANKQIIFPRALVFAVCTGVAKAAACYGAGGFLKDKWPNCFQPAGSPNLLVYSGKTADNEYMKLGLHVPGHSGWSAIALAGNGGMKGARQIVVRMSGSPAKWVAEDRYSFSYSEPILQVDQDVRLMFASENGGGTSWGVLLPMDACKADQDGYPTNYPFFDSMRWMHWALGESHQFTYHKSRRGAFVADLISGNPAPAVATNLLEVDVLMPNVEVKLGAGGSDQANPYICAFFDLSQLVPDKDVTSKHHVVKFAPKLSTSSEKYVHHMILYGCNTGAGFSDAVHNKVIADCERMPRGCYELKWPWAVGSTDVILPADVGFPFGEGHRWLALQMHYYNPLLHSGVRDSSGVALSFSPTLRPHDAGVMVFNGGVSPHMRPAMPIQPRVDLSFTVPPECTQSWSGPITLHGVAHHSHLLGKRLNIDVLRKDGLNAASSSYVGALIQENQYDFNHQTLTPPVVKQLHPGDEIAMSCSYDTSSRLEQVVFGDLTQTEMCFAAVMYYPAQHVDHFTYFTHFAETVMGLTGTQQRTRCGGAVKTFTPTSYSVPGCSKKGNLSASSATRLCESFKLQPDMPGLNNSRTQDRPDQNSSRTAVVSGNPMPRLTLPCLIVFSGMLACAFQE